MLSSLSLTLALSVAALAAPRPADTTCTESVGLSTSYSSTTVVTQSATRTITHTISSSSPATASSSSSSTGTYTGNITQPSAPFTVISARSGSPVHLLEMNAAGFRFNLGGNTATYCPTEVSEEGPNACPAGNLTAILGTCAMVSLSQPLRIMLTRHRTQKYLEVSRSGPHQTGRSDTLKHIPSSCPLAAFLVRSLGTNQPVRASGISAQVSSVPMDSWLAH